MVPKVALLSGTILNEKNNSVNQGQVENKVYFLFDCSKYEDARETFSRKIKEIDKIYLNHVNKINNLKTYLIRDL